MSNTEFIHPVQMRPEHSKEFEPHPDENTDTSSLVHVDDDWARGWE